MATKLEKISRLALETSRFVTASPENWKSFLDSAAWLYKYPFRDQLLIHAQKPEATACAEIGLWNERLHRWVNRGAKGIAMFDSSYTGQARLKYYFDIADTHESSRPRPVPIWDVKPEYEKEIIEALENSFGQLQEKADLGVALTSAAANAMEDNFSDYLAELIYYKENSFLESFDEETIEAMFKPLLQTSIGYMLLVHCGIDPAAYYSREDFTYLGGFNTLPTLNALGTATSDISQMCLSEIARTVLSLQRQEQQQNRTFEDTARKEYAVGEEQKPQTERSNDHDADHIQQTGRLSATQPSPASGAGDSPWEVRIDAPPLSAAEPESDLHESADHRDAEQPSEGDRADSSDPDRADGIPDGEERGHHGGTEGHRPDEMGGADEQPQSIGGGADSGGTDLRIEQEPAAPEIVLTAAPELPPLLEERFITAILENQDDDLKSPKTEIQNFFREHYEQNKRAEYLKSVYPDRFTELIVDGTRIGYKAITDGLLMWEGAYLTRTKESVFSWGIVAELTGNLIDQGTYFFDAKIKAPPSYEDQQISFMDGGYLAPEPEDDQQFTFFSQPELPQQVIDEALCIGFNDRDSRLIICAQFMKDKPLEENAVFLQKKYGSNGAGLFINEQEYAVWYDPKGIRVSTGRSAQKRHATLLSWTQAAKRIRELLDLGRYMPQSELDRVQDFERLELARSLIYARRDFTDEAKQGGYLPLTSMAYSGNSGFPEIEAQMQHLMEDPGMLSQLVDEWTLFASAHEHNPNLLRGRWYDPKALVQRLEDLQREPIIFTATEDYDPQRQFYISDDELDKLVLSGNGDYRLDVYAFFANHPDTKEREKYLSHYHGEYSGSHSGNDNTTYTYKQLHFSHGNISQPHAQVTLTWNKVLRRIESLMQSGKWLSEADRAAMGDYELNRLAHTIHQFFYDVPEDIPRPSNHENEYSGNFFTSAWRQFRKRNAYPVAITQNVDYLLDAPQARSMLSNSEFIVMLNQAENDQERLSQLLNISPEQMTYVNGAEAGSGLLRYGNALVPFVNKFPADTELYKLITTRPGEGVFAKWQVDDGA